MADPEHVESICHLNGRLWGNFEAEGWALGEHISIVRTENELFTDDDLAFRARSHLFILGFDYSTSRLPFDYPVELHQPVINVYVDPQKEQTFLAHKQPFTIGFIPMAIDVGVTGRVGVDLDLDAGFSRYCTDGAEHEMEEALYLRGAVTPHVGVNVYAGVEVYAGFASAGVRAELTFLQLRLPFSVQLGIGATDSAHPWETALLHASARLDLGMEVLKGEIVAYVWTWLGELKKTLFSWRGAIVNENIFEEAGNMPVSAL